MSELVGIPYTFVATTTQTASGNSSLLTTPIYPDEMTLYLNCTAASGTNPTLDVYVCSATPDLTSIYDFIHFTQLITTGKKLMRWSHSSANNATGADLTTGVHVLAAATAVNGPISLGPLGRGAYIRVDWVITGTTPSFTFQLTGFLSRWRDYDQP